MNLEKIHLILFFKPYYNWNTFNTSTPSTDSAATETVGFKPYYNWNTFNTSKNCNIPKEI